MRLDKVRELGKKTLSPEQFDAVMAQFAGTQRMSSQTGLRQQSRVKRPRKRSGIDWSSSRPG